MGQSSLLLLALLLVCCCFRSPISPVVPWQCVSKDERGSKREREVGKRNMMKEGKWRQMESGRGGGGSGKKKSHVLKCSGSDQMQLYSPETWEQVAVLCLLLFLFPSFYPCLFPVSPPQRAIFRNCSVATRSSQTHTHKTWRDSFKQITRLDHKLMPKWLYQ